MEKNKQPIPDFSEVHVKLKPIFGIKPGIYLIGIYSFIILLAFFMLFIFPGITNNGSLVQFDTVPGEAIVKIDDKYIGSTPVDIFTKSGLRKIEIAKPFYKKIILNEKIDGAVFGSLFSPLKKKITNYLELEDIDGLLSLAISDYAPIGILNDFTFGYQLPPILSDAAKASYANNGKTDQIQKKLYDFLDNAKYFVDSEQELYEYAKASSSVAGRGGVLTISSLLNLVSKMIQDEKKHDNYPVWILQTLPQALIKTDAKVIDKYVMYTKLEQSKWFVDFSKTYADNLSSTPVVTGPASSTGSIFVDGKQHNLISGGMLVMGNSSAITPDDLIREDFPHKVEVKKFYMSVSEVTNSEYYKFTRENPEWMQSNTKALIDKKLVTDSYLRTWKNDKPDDSALNLPVTEISYHAAHAYCEWLTKKAPAGLKVRLPYESEWEYIAKSDEQVAPFILPETPKKEPQAATTSASDRFGLKNIYGNVWAWCENWFFPASYPLYNSENSDYTDTELTGAEKSIRGGSWANVKGDGLRSFTRASLMPDFCNPYTGFRTVIADH